VPTATPFGAEALPNGAHIAKKTRKKRHFPQGFE
jgi:hypothetical protein